MSNNNLPKPANLPITIEEATPKDLPDITSLILAAFANDDVNLLIYPPTLSGSNPAAVHADALKGFRLRLLSSDRTYLVALAPSDPENITSKSQIVGAACWRRRHGSTSARSKGNAIYPSSTEAILFPRDLFLKRLELKLTQIVEYVSSIFIPTPPDVKNWAGLKLYYDTMDSAETELYNTPASQERWELENLAVDPVYQGLGVGGKLVDWGCQRADEEGVACTLEASADGMRVYSKKGFVNVREEIIMCPSTGMKAAMTLMRREAKKI